MGLEETPRYSRRVVFVFVDNFDLSAIGALHYARSLRPALLRGVHLVIDSVKAERLREAWLSNYPVPLDFVDCSGRRVTRCAADLIRHEAQLPGVQVAVILPGHSFSPQPGGWHRGTAHTIASVVSRVPNVAVTIFPPSTAVSEWLRSDR